MVSTGRRSTGGARGVVKLHLTRRCVVVRAVVGLTALGTKRDAEGHCAGTCMQHTCPSTCCATMGAVGSGVCTCQRAVGGCGGLWGALHPSVHVHCSAPRGLSCRGAYIHTYIVV